MYQLLPNIDMDNAISLTVWSVLFFKDLTADLTRPGTKAWRIFRIKIANHVVYISRPHSPIRTEFVVTDFVAKAWP